MFDTSKFLDRFEELGLSRNEAAVYLALLQNHPVTGYKLAKEISIHKATVYESLTRLVEKGGAKVVKGSSELYSPISPESFLASLEKRFTDARSHLIDGLKNINKQEETDDEFWNLTGKDTILASIQEFAGKAEKSILFYINNEMYVTFLGDILSKKVASGIKVKGFSYRSLDIPGADLYSYKISSDIKEPYIADDRLIFVIDNYISFIADMDKSKACQSMRPAQVDTAKEFIQMKIALYRMSQVFDYQKLSLYLFEEDKLFLEKYQQEILSL